MPRAPARAAPATPVTAVRQPTCRVNPRRVGSAGWRLRARHGESHRNDGEIGHQHRIPLPLRRIRALHRQPGGEDFDAVVRDDRQQVRDTRGEAGDHPLVDPGAGLSDGANVPGTTAAAPSNAVCSLRHRRRHRCPRPCPPDTSGLRDLRTFNGLGEALGPPNLGDSHGRQSVCTRSRCSSPSSSCWSRRASPRTACRRGGTSRPASSRPAVCCCSARRPRRR